MWRFICIIALAGQVVAAAEPVVRMLVPGFSVEELPVKLSNQNNLRFAPDGSLTSLGYDGKVWRLRDSNGDGLEDAAEVFWDKPTLSVPLGMAWTERGLLVSSKGKVSLLKDADGDGKAEAEEIIASGWPATDVGSGGVDATAVTVDAEGNVYFGLLVADYSNAYRLRKRKDLKPAEIEWLKAQSRWREGGAEDEFSLYDINSRRGTIQKWDTKTKQLSTIATGMRVPVALAFNRAGDLFNTDQEGETWMPNGNPFDELNHIVAGKNYGFPPAHEKWLPGLKSEEPVVGFGPQHQSACGLVFNDPSAKQGLFGPASWEGNAFVAGESRARIWRTQLIKTESGYVGVPQTIARVSMLTMDMAISRRGDMYVACHSGPPDWGTGPQGAGKIFRIRYTDTNAPTLLACYPASATEVRVNFDRAVDVSAVSTNAFIEFGEYVSAGDRFEVLKPPYAVVGQQDATPRARLGIHSAKLEDGGRTLALTTDPHPMAVRYAISLPGVVDTDYDLTRAFQPVAGKVSRESWGELVAWAPKIRASGGTDSRAAAKPDGDWETGRGLFFGAQLQCSKCHRIRGEGGTAGPDLSNLLHRDMASVLRDIREPSATIHPDYVTFQAVLRNGESTQGFVRSQKAESVTMFDAEGKETVFARKDIESLRPTELSLMPAGLLEGRKESEVRDLLTFLLWEPPKRTAESVRKLRKKAEATKQLQIVLVASKQDHGAGQHDYPAWQTNWTRVLNKAANARAETAWEWPSAAQFQSASAIVFYYWNHKWSAERLAELDAFLQRGGGVTLIHSAVIADAQPEDLAVRIGLSAHPRRTGYRHMPFELKMEDRKHAITEGLPERIQLLDEPYWPLIGEAKDVHVLASARVDGAMRPLVWTRGVGKGRVFASIVGHYTWTLDDPLFRLLLLRGIAWSAGENANRFDAVE